MPFAETMPTTGTHKCLAAGHFQSPLQNPAMVQVQLNNDVTGRSLCEYEILGSAYNIKSNAAVTQCLSILGLQLPT